ncbi:MAG TPA: zf-HC2 domain-containing protein [Longimicrobiales bacterium]
MKSRTTAFGARHPGDGAWRAYIDGELPWLRRVTLQLHAMHCGACRERLEEVRGRGARVAALLGATPRVADVGEAWARVMVRSGLRPRSAWSPASAFLAGGLSMATLAASVLLITPTPTRLLGQYHGVGTFANVLDRCCSDAEGGEAFAREGVLLLDMPGLETPVKVQYSDVDGSGDLSTGDIVRSITRVRRRPR